jgi:hypothetical protein
MCEPYLRELNRNEYERHTWARTWPAATSIHSGISHISKLTKLIHQHSAKDRSGKESWPIISRSFSYRVSLARKAEIPVQVPREANPVELYCSCQGVLEHVDHGFSARSIGNLDTSEQNSVREKVDLNIQESVACQTATCYFLYKYYQHSSRWTMPYPLRGRNVLITGGSRYKDYPTIR